MNKTEFINYAAQQIKTYLPVDIAQDISIEPVQIVKLNDQKLNSLRFHRRDDTPQPTIYLDQAYDKFRSGESVDSIFSQIADSYLDASRSEVTPAVPDLSYDSVKEKFGFRLIEIARNKEFLRDVPNMTVGNGLALVCDIRISDDGAGGFFSTMVNNNVLESLGCSKSDVFRHAMADAWEVTPPSLFSMEDKIFGFEEPENLLAGGKASSKSSPMYILSNDTGVYGAAALFYPEVQGMIADALGDNYYALPSSLHEFIIVPESSEPTEKELAKMVKQANKSIVEPADVLSDNVLKYDMASKTLEILDESRKLDKKLAERVC